MDPYDRAINELQGAGALITQSLDELRKAKHDAQKMRAETDAELKRLSNIQALSRKAIINEHVTDAKIGYVKAADAINKASSAAWDKSEAQFNRFGTASRDGIIGVREGINDGIIGVRDGVNDARQASMKQLNRFGSSSNDGIASVRREVVNVYDQYQKKKLYEEQKKVYEEVMRCRNILKEGSPKLAIADNFKASYPPPDPPIVSASKSSSWFSWLRSSADNSSSRPQSPEILSPRPYSPDIVSSRPYSPDIASSRPPTPEILSARPYFPEILSPRPYSPPRPEILSPRPYSPEIPGPPRYTTRPSSPETQLPPPPPPTRRNSLFGSLLPPIPRTSGGGRKLFN